MFHAARLTQSEQPFSEMFCTILWFWRILPGWRIFPGYLFGGNPIQSTSLHPSSSYPFDLCKRAKQSTQHYIDLVDSFNQPQRQQLFFGFSI